MRVSPEANSEASGCLTRRPCPRTSLLIATCSLECRSDGGGRCCLLSGASCVASLKRHTHRYFGHWLTDRYSDLSWSDHKASRS
jgi:hypothetical protein